MATKINPIMELQRAVRKTHEWRFRDPNIAWTAFHHAVRFFLKGNFIAAINACRRTNPKRDGCTTFDVVHLEALALRALHLSSGEEVLSVIGKYSP